MNFEIKVTGSGSKLELVDALKQLADSIKKLHNLELGGKTFEDPYLCAEIKEQ